jgi:hypothetical protein
MIRVAAHDGTRIPSSEAAMMDVALVFAQLTNSCKFWSSVTEQLTFKRLAFMDEVRAEVLQKATLDALEVHFPGAIPPAIVKRVKAELDLARLERWHKLAVESDLTGLMADVS